MGRCLLVLPEVCKLSGLCDEVFGPTFYKVLEERMMYSKYSNTDSQSNKVYM